MRCSVSRMVGSREESLKIEEVEDERLWVGRGRLNVELEGLGGEETSS